MTGLSQVAASLWEVLEVVDTQLTQCHAGVLKDKLQKREDAMGHNNELITKLARQAKPVKVTLDNLPNIVEKLEQKAKLHDMA